MNYISDKNKKESSFCNFIKKNEIESIDILYLEFLFINENTLLFQ